MILFADGLVWDHLVELSWWMGWSRGSKTASLKRLGRDSWNTEPRGRISIGTYTQALSCLWSQGNWMRYTAPDFPHLELSKGSRRKWLGFSKQLQNWPNVTSAILYWLKQWLAHSDSRAGNVDSQLSIGRMLVSGYGPSKRINVKQSSEIIKLINWILRV